MCPLHLLVVVAVKVLGVVTPSPETRSVCNDANVTIVSVSIDICARIKIISQDCQGKKQDSAGNRDDSLTAEPRMAW